MRNNSLRMLPLEMGKWAKLKRLLAGGNSILEVPAEVWWGTKYGKGMGRIEMTAPAR